MAATWHWIVAGTETRSCGFIPTSWEICAGCAGFPPQFVILCLVSLDFLSKLLNLALPAFLPASRMGIRAKHDGSLVLTSPSGKWYGRLHLRTRSIGWFGLWSGAEAEDSTQQRHLHGSPTKSLCFFCFSGLLWCHLYIACLTYTFFLSVCNSLLASH